MHDPLEHLRHEADRFSVPDQDLNDVLTRGRRARRRNHAAAALITAAVFSLGAVAIASAPRFGRQNDPVIAPPDVVEPRTKARIAQFTFELLQGTFEGAVFDYKDVERTERGWVAIYQPNPRFTHRLKRIETVHQQLVESRRQLRRAQKEIEERVLSGTGRGERSGEAETARSALGRLEKRADDFTKRIAELRQELEESQLQTEGRSAPVGSESRMSIFIEDVDGRFVITDVEGPIPEARDRLLGRGGEWSDFDPQPVFRVADVQLDRRRGSELGYTLRVFYMGQIPEAVENRCRIRLMVDNESRVARIGPLYAPFTEDDRDEMLISGSFKDVPGRRTDLPVQAACWPIKGT